LYSIKTILALVGRKITLEYGLKKALPKIEEYFSKVQTIDHIKIEDGFNNLINMAVKLNKEEVLDFTNKILNDLLVERLVKKI
jgi:hypothetical protein